MQTDTSTEYRLLDTAFRVSADDPACLRYTDTFLGAYGDGPEPGGPARVFQIAISTAAPDHRRGRPAQTVPIHKSKHEHWSFSGELSSADPRSVTWVGRGISVVQSASDSWEVSVDRPADEAIVGESIFHLLRSLAVYVRDGARGCMLHASGVVGRGGKAVLFIGGVSAGKTTTLTEAVIRYGLTPLTNDRAWIRLDPSPHVVSWPSYASYCEGTLLNYPDLADAAKRFESIDNPMLTIRNQRELRPAFDKHSKRIYPMSWLTDALDCQYEKAAPLGTVIVTHLDVKLSSGSVAEVDLNDPAQRSGVLSTLDRERFDSTEPSFLPWHGLELPHSALTSDALLLRLSQAGVRFMTLQTSPRELSLLRDVLE